MKLVIALSIWLATELVSVNAYTGSFSRRDEIDIVNDFSLNLLARRYLDEAQAADDLIARRALNRLVRRTRGNQAQEQRNQQQQGQNQQQQNNNQQQQQHNQQQQTNNQQQTTLNQLQTTNNQLQNQHNQAQNQNNQQQQAQNQRILANQPGKAEQICDTVVGICTTIGAAVGAAGASMLAHDLTSDVGAHLAAVGAGVTLLGTAYPQIKETSKLCYNGVCKITAYCSGCLKKGQTTNAAHNTGAVPTGPPGQGIPHNPGSMVRRDVLSKILVRKGLPRLEIRDAFLGDDLWY